MASFSGTWKVVSAENGREFMSSLGLPLPQVDAIMSARPDIIIQRENSRFQITVDYAQNPREAKFTLGETFDYRAANGQTIEAVAQLEGEKLLKIEAGEMESAEYELQGEGEEGRLAITMKHKGVSCKMTYKK